jgi:hypothetical protein
MLSKRIGSKKINENRTTTEDAQKRSMVGSYMDGIRIELLGAPDDPHVSDLSFQAELAAFSARLTANRIEHSQLAIALNSVNAGGWPLAEFIITLTPAIVAPLAALCGAWLQARYGRKVRLKIGDVEAEGRTLEEIEHLLRRAKTFRTDAPEKTREPSEGNDG